MCVSLLRGGGLTLNLPTSFVFSSGLTGSRGHSSLCGLRKEDPLDTLTLVKDVGNKIPSLVTHPRTHTLTHTHTFIYIHIYTHRNMNACYGVTPCEIYRRRDVYGETCCCLFVKKICTNWLNYLKKV